MIDLREANSGGYRAYWENGVCLGDIYREVDGYYVWWQKDGGGCWTADILNEIVKTLNSLNREWDEIVRKECTGPSSEWQTGSRYIPSIKDSCPFDGLYKE